MVDIETPKTNELGWFKTFLKELRYYLMAFKVVFVSLILWNVTVTYHMIVWFQLNHKDLSEAAAAGFIGIIMALLANIKWAMEKSVD